MNKFYVWLVSIIGMIIMLIFETPGVKGAVCALIAFISYYIGKSDKKD